MQKYIYKFEEAASLRLAKLAEISARNPSKTLKVFFVVCLICMSGMITVQYHTDFDEIFVVKDSTIARQFSEVENLYGKTPKPSSLIITSKKDSPGNNIINKATFDEIFSLHEGIKSVVTSGGYRLEDICFNDILDDCTESMVGILKLWNFNKSAFQNEITSDDDVAAACISSQFPDFSPIRHDSLFGEYRLNANGTKALARSINLQYLIKAEVEGSEEISLEWEKLVASFVESFKANEIEVYILNEQMVLEQQDLILLNQLILMAITSTVLVSFVAVNIGDIWSRLNSRIVFAVIDISLILFSGVAGFGPIALVGVAFVPIAQAVPFLFLALGVDSSFVIAAAFDQTDPSLPDHERAFLCIRKVGMAVTASTLTNVLCLATGLIFKVEAAQSFASYTLGGLVFIYFMHLTAFMALLAIDSQRKAKNRKDPLFCYYVVETPTTENESTSPRPSNGESELEPKSIGTSDIETEREESKPKGAEIFRKLVEAILSSVFSRVFIIIVFIAALGGSIYASTTLEIGIADDMFVGLDSYAAEYFEKYESIPGDQFRGQVMGLFTGRLKYEECEIQEDILQLSDEITQSRYVESEIGNWIAAFSAWTTANPLFNSSCVSGNSFIPALKLFLATDQNFVFNSSLIFSEDGETLTSTRIIFQLTAERETSEKISLLNELEDIVQKSSLNPAPVISSYEFRYYDRERSLVLESYLSLGTSVAVVLVVSFLFLIDLRAVVIMTILIFSCLGHMFGALKLAGLPLNVVAVINMITGVGFCVDYSMHLIHAFKTHDKIDDVRYRIVTTYESMGSAVLLALVSTFLGVCVVFFSTYLQFVYFANQTVITVFVSALHAYILLPVLLYYAFGSRQASTIDTELITSTL